MVLTLKNILAATDFSEMSEVVFIYAREFAHVFGGTLHVLHVAPYVTTVVVKERHAESFDLLDLLLDVAERRHDHPRR